MTRHPWILVAAIAALANQTRAAEPPAEPDHVMSSSEIEHALHPEPSPSESRGLGRIHDPQPPPSINLKIPFDHDSSAITPRAEVQLQQLAKTLKEPSMAKDRFVVAGHTDAQGRADYNKQLSLRRAQAVKRFLVDKGMDGLRIEAVGYGSEHLLSPDRPEDPSNRRVQVTDLGASP
jgi:outer membrane protein OmpA-like peptidoglycan-associated protein